MVRTAETVFVDPAVMTTSTTYLAPTTLLTPASYEYASPTAYYAPVGYYRTRYVLPRRYRYRPVVTATSYYDYGVTPTTYFAPTVSYAPLSATSYGSICDEPARVTTGKVESEPASPTTPGRREVAGPSAAAERRVPPRMLSSDPKDDPAAKDKAEATDPASPPASDPPPADAALPQIDREVKIPGPNDPNPRFNQAPAFGDSAVLRGEVLSLGQNEPVSGIKVEILSQTNPAAFKDLTGTTDADGRFAIRVPTSGKWTAHPQARRQVPPGGFHPRRECFSDANGEFNGLTLRP